MGKRGRDDARNVRGGDRSRRVATTRLVRLCVDARDALRDARGIGRYVRELLRRFAATDAIALTLLVDAPVPQLARGGFRRLVGGDAFRLARRVPPESDVVWHPWNGTFFPGGPAVATIHDVVPFAYPDPDPRKRESQQAPFRRSASSAAILTDSGFSRDEIERRLGVEPGRIWVVPLGVEPAFSPGPAEPHPEFRGRRYVLYVGTGERHKNGQTLVEGFRRAFPAQETALAAIGMQLPPGPGFVSLPRVSEAELVALYRGALFVAAPGLYEGFGLPLLEAMASGSPVLASRAGPYPELSGDAAAYVDFPADPKAWAAALADLAGDEFRRGILRARGLERAAGFTWERTAAATLDVLRAHARPDGTSASASAVRN